MTTRPSGADRSELAMRRGRWALYVSLYGIPSRGPGGQRQRAGGGHQVGGGGAGKI